MTTVDEDDDTEASNMRVSVASVASKQTQSTNKSVIGLDKSPQETPGSKAKRARTQRSFYTPEESNVETEAKSKASSKSTLSPARSAKRNLAAVLDDDEEDEDAECDTYVSKLERKYLESKVAMKAETKRKARLRARARATRPSFACACWLLRR